GHAAAAPLSRLRQRLELEGVGSVARGQLRLRARERPGEAVVECPAQGPPAHQPESGDAAQSLPPPPHPHPGDPRPPGGAGEGGLTVEAATSEPVAAPRRRRRLRLTTPALLGLPTSWLLVFFLAPIAIVAAYSVNVLVLAPTPQGFTLSAWRSLFSSSN